MIVILLIASVAASTVRSLVTKRVSAASGRLAAFGRVNALMSACALAVILTYTAAAGSFAVSYYTAGMALLYALFTIAAQLCFMHGLAEGDIAAVTFIYSCGFVIPTCIGTVLYHETLSILRILGVVLLIAAFRLCAAQAPQEEASAQLRTGSGRGCRWIVYALIAMCSSGAVGLIQKLHQHSAYSGELGGFLTTAFSVCFVLSCVMALTDRQCPSVPRGERLPACLGGLCIGGANLMNLYLAGVLPAMVTFPVLNGGVIVATAAAAAVLYGEKPHGRRAVGIVLGIAAIVMIAL